MPDILMPTLFAAIFALASASALISALETSLLSLEPFELHKIGTRSKRLASTVELLARDPRQAHVILTLADTLINVPLAVIGFYVLGFTGLPLVVCALILALFIAIPCDLLPKLFALVRGRRLARPALHTLRVFMYVLGPVSRALQSIENAIVGRAVPEPSSPSKHPREEELEAMIELKEEQGAIDETEAVILEEIIALGSKRARDLITPRVDLFAINDNLSNDEALRAIKRRRFRRVPVYGETTDDILGVLDVQEFLLHPGAHYTQYLSTPSFVPETLNALDLMRGLLKQPRRMAVVLDEYGGTEGIVTLNDIMEEILSDALPEGEKPMYIERLDDARILVSGRARVDDVERELGRKLDGRNDETMHNFIVRHAGLIPRTGAELTLKGFRLVVSRSNRKRIREVLVQTAQNDGAKGS
jgi:CBS domain containing-hemolysin-like protein